jgi:hypothetical protein
MTPFSSSSISLPPIHIRRYYQIVEATSGNNAINTSTNTSLCSESNGTNNSLGEPGVNAITTIKFRQSICCYSGCKSRIEKDRTTHAAYSHSMCNKHYNESIKQQRLSPHHIPPPPRLPPLPSPSPFFFLLANHMKN